MEKKIKETKAKAKCDCNAEISALAAKISKLEKILLDSEVIRPEEL